MCPDRHQINLQIDVPQNIPNKVTQTPACVTVSYYFSLVLGTKMAGLK